MIYRASLRTGGKFQEWLNTKMGCVPERCRGLREGKSACYSSIPLVNPENSLDNSIVLRSFWRLKLEALVIALLPVLVKCLGKTGRRDAEKSHLLWERLWQKLEVLIPVTEDLANIWPGHLNMSLIHVGTGPAPRLRTPCRSFQPCSIFVIVWRFLQTFPPLPSVLVDAKCFVL